MLTFFLTSAQCGVVSEPLQVNSPGARKGPAARHISPLGLSCEHRTPSDDFTFSLISQAYNAISNSLKRVVCERSPAFKVTARARG